MASLEFSDAYATTANLSFQANQPTSSGTPLDNAYYYLFVGEGASSGASFSGNYVVGTLYTYDGNYNLINSYRGAINRQDKVGNDTELLQMYVFPAGTSSTSSPSLTILLEAGTRPTLNPNTTYSTSSDPIAAAMNSLLQVNAVSTQLASVAPAPAAAPVLAVDSITVNEGSPYIVFTVTGVALQDVKLSTTSGSATVGSDTGSGLQYFDGASWQNYTPGAYVQIPGGGTTLLVRTTVTQDQLNEGSQSFTLTATNADNVGADGTGTIRDDGQGAYYPDNNTGATDPTKTGSALDDDRPLSVNSVTVNEASPYIVFTVTGAANQYVKLSTTSGSASVGTDTGSGLQYFDGTNWQNYAPGAYVQIPGGGTTLLVRTTVSQDLLNEGTESFTLTATNTGNVGASGTGTIRDDGQGDIFVAGNNSNTPNSPGDLGYPAGLDDDRPVSITGSTVNEASPNIVFKVSGVAGQQVQLSLGQTGAELDNSVLNGGARVDNTGATDITGGNALEYFDGTSWQSYTPGAYVSIQPGGELLVRAKVVNDTDYEGLEGLRLTATNAGGASSTGDGFIRDDGQGSYFADSNNTFTPAAPGGFVSNDDRPVSITGSTVNEASPNIVFKVSGVAGQQVQLSLGQTGAELDNSVLNGGARVDNTGATDITGGNALEYFDGTSWQSYTPGAYVSIQPGGELLVRAKVVNDTVYEGLEGLRLTATNAGGASSTGDGFIRDDGQGSYFADSNNTFTPAAPGGFVSNDDRPVSITGSTVNEASPNIVFKVSGVAGQQVQLSLGQTGAELDNSVLNGGARVDNTGATDITGGNALEYYNGTSWQSYTPGAYVSIQPGGELLVRAKVVNDTDYEGLEGLRLTATNAGGASSTGDGFIRDDGQGSYFADSNNTFTPAAPGGFVSNDDRPVSITGSTVNEASPNIVFKVSGVAGQQVQLSLGQTGAELDNSVLNGGARVDNTGATDITGGNALEYFDGTSWQSYTPGAYVSIQPGGELLVRAKVVNDTVYEGLEGLRLTATNAGGASSAGDGFIRDDGQGSYFADSNNTFTPAAPGGFVSNDDRPVSITGSTVNEASPNIVFKVSGVAGQQVQLSLGQTGAELDNSVLNGGARVDNTGATDITGGNALEYYNGTSWQSYTPRAYVSIQPGGELLVRAKVVNDTVYEGLEGLRLTATNAGGASLTGDGFIRDDGQGSYFADSNNTFTPAAPGGFVSNDDRPVSITGSTVNEASPNIVFKVSGVAGQQVQLSLGQTGAELDNSVLNGGARVDNTGATDITGGNALEYYNGTSWQSYTPRAYVSIQPGGELLVRAKVVNDTVYEGLEGLRLTATNAGGASSTGDGFIRDDGQGSYFADSNNTFTPAAPGGFVSNDDRPVSITGSTVNEASPNIVFKVSGVAGQQVQLSLGQTGAELDNSVLNGGARVDNTGATDITGGNALEYYNGTSWQSYTPGAYVSIQPGGELLVRAKVVNDTVYEGLEGLRLTATNAGGASSAGDGFIRDDGQGSYFGNKNKTFTPAAPGGFVSNDDRPVSITGSTVNEASPNIVFKVSGVAGQQVQLSLGQTGAELDNSVLNGGARVDNTGATDITGGNALEYYNGTSWQSYTPRAYVSIQPGGELLVRAKVVNDTVYEGLEGLRLTATNAGGASSTGDGFIRDDGQGSYFADSNNTFTPAAPGGFVSNDDRPVSITGSTVNEASPNIVFKVSGVAGQQVQLSLGQTGAELDNSVLNGGARVDNTGATDITGGNALEYYNGTSWQSYTPRAYVSIQPGGELLVRAKVVNDTVYEGLEGLRLTATNAGGASLTGDGFIRDDGQGSYYADSNNTFTPAAPGGFVADNDLQQIMSNLNVNALNKIIGLDSCRDVLSGTNADDQIYGLGGNDDINGNAGNDYLVGGAGNDRIFGGEGNDKLVGGPGSNYLEGGQGNDVFVFSNENINTTNSAIDAISDFSPQADKIDLSLLDASLLLTGRQALEWSSDKATFHAKAGELIFQKFSSYATLSADVNGDKNPDITIKILGVHDLNEFSQNNLIF